MRVQIDNLVHDRIEEFYSISMELHPSLSLEAVLAKKDRLYSAIRDLSIYASIYPLARVNAAWIAAGYREMICEDFHFAFDLVDLDNGETIVYVFDAVHSLLNH